MRYRAALLALAATFVAAFIASTFVLSLHASSAGLVSEAPVDVATCDAVISVVLVGQGGPYEYSEGVTQGAPDPEFAAWCADLSRVPAIIGFSIVAVGLTAAIAWVILFRRVRRESRYGRPISRATSHLGLPDLDSNQEPID